MKSKGVAVRAHDVVPYIMCLGDDGKAARTAQADRAFHPDDLKRQGSELRIGPVSSTSPTFADLTQIMISTSIRKYCNLSSDYAIPLRARNDHALRSVLVSFTQLKSGADRQAWTLRDTRAPRAVKSRRSRSLLSSHKYRIRSGSRMSTTWHSSASRAKRHSPSKACWMNL